MEASPSRSPPARMGGWGRGREGDRRGRGEGRGEGGGGIGREDGGSQVCLTQGAVSQLDSANGYMRCVSSVTLTIRRSVKGYLQVDDAACSL